MPINKLIKDSGISDWLELLKDFFCLELLKTKTGVSREIFDIASKHSQEGHCSGQID
ncbi:predicted protein [Sclerotinia sclerotiorum 1980 UF-70]|uniref:Uncharacterized protein n=1 Tax=Sclerotinia sclerotiorum (strain ATCC 18683 / 1980 / Ss-1) TaxID=665079 RepID=A7EMX1_SCLS1|nr:predicted protein [Sclerotinia sclerotiorum 1980 UF-70]EDO04187.1 predicted protein [Sclerotinia sclerotiorum 1980 UF-70]